MQLELRQLRYFLAVAEELNFSRAAERLHIAQPALSAQIRTLETQLGSELFHRTTRKVELTAAGQLLLPDGRELVERADRAAAKLVAAARGQQGRLRIGFVAHAAGEISTEILRRFGAVYPGIEVELVEARTLEVSQAAVAGQETDAAFVWLPILHEELDSEPVAFERKLVAMQPEHRLARSLRSSRTSSSTSRSSRPGTTTRRKRSRGGWRRSAGRGSRSMSSRRASTSA